MEMAQNSTRFELKPARRRGLVPRARAKNLEVPMVVQQAECLERGVVRTAFECALPDRREFHPWVQT